MGAVVVGGAGFLLAVLRLGSRTDDLVVQSQLARRIWRDHVFCLASMALLVLVQVGAAVTA